MTGSECATNVPALAPELDLSSHVLPDPPCVSFGSSSHGDRASDKVRSVKRELRPDKSTHRQADYGDRGLTGGLDQMCRILREVRDRPRFRRRAGRLADSTIVERRVPEERLEVWDLPGMPVGSEPAAACKPDEVRPLAELLIMNGDVVECQLHSSVLQLTAHGSLLTACGHLLQGLMWLA